MPLWLPLVQPCMYSTGVSSEADFAGSSVCLSHSFMCPSASIPDPKLYATSGLRITLQPDTKLLGLRYFFRANLSSVSLCVSKAYVPFLGVITSSLLRAGQLLMKLFSWSWPSCWPPGIRRTWGSEGSSLSPSGCRFSLGPAQNRTALDDPCSPWWWLWSGGQDSPLGEQERWLLTLHRYSR